LSFLLRFWWVVLVGPTGLAAAAQEAPPLSAVSFELDDNSHVVLDVELSTGTGPDATTRTFRFLLDTGAGITMIDSSVPGDLFWPDPSTALEVTDSSGVSGGALELVVLKRLRVGGVAREGLLAARADLKGGFIGTIEDRPVDGVLGMTFLHGLRFLLEPGARRIVWWGSLAGDVSLPLSFNASGCPVVRLQRGGAAADFIPDTGMSATLSIPRALVGELQGQASTVVGFHGKASQGREVVVDRLEAAGYAWRDLPADVLDGEEPALVGLGVWLAAPVVFDFATQSLELSPRPDGSLPALPGWRRNLPVGWDRNGAAQALRVVGERPGSPLQRAGLRVGDRVLQVGSLSGPALTRRAIQELRAKGLPTRWVIERGGEKLELTVEAEP
jgi:hypothetical protein